MSRNNTESPQRLLLDRRPQLLKMQSVVDSSYENNGIHSQFSEALLTLDCFFNVHGFSMFEPRFFSFFVFFYSAGWDFSSLTMRFL